MAEYKTLAIDFDGVIHGYSEGWKGGEIYDPPIEGAVEAYCELIRRGYELVIFTTRDTTEKIKCWMDKYFDFETALGYQYEPNITNIKPIAIAYIDDRGIRFTNWNEILSTFE